MENTIDNGAHSFTEGAIYQDKSGSKTAESISLKGTLIIELTSKNDWINKIPKILPTKINGENFIFLDKNGNSLFIGHDFIIAEERYLFPVYVYRAESVTSKYREL